MYMIVFSYRALHTHTSFYERMDEQPAADYSVKLDANGCSGSERSRDHLYLSRKRKKIRNNAFKSICVVCSLSTYYLYMYSKMTAASYDK